MEDRPSSTSKPSASSSPSQSATTDIKSPTSRPLYSSKLGDQRGRDPTARHPLVPPPKAWNSAKNPITGRSQTPSQNNFNSHKLQSVINSFREGQRVRITLVTGAEFEGIYANSPEPGIIRLNMVQQKKLPNSADVNGSNPKPANMMSFRQKEITEARVVANNMGKNDGKAPNGNRSSFRTDTAISNSKFGNERTLQRWTPDSTAEVDGSLDMASDNAGTWDQFAVNERLFGIKTNYDESFYTTTIDKSHPQYRERMAAAERKAREIERSTAATSHVAEERVMDFVGGDDRDEEEKYSGVRRQQDFPPLATTRENKYTPPARRAPTAHSTVKGAPVDPAIISSQLKSTPVPKQPSPRTEESKTSSQPMKPSTPAADANADSKGDEKAEVKAPETKTDAKPAEKTPASIRPSAATSRTISPLVKDGMAPSTIPGFENTLLHQFKKFADQQRGTMAHARSSKAKADKEVKLHELKKFSTTFKLSTPVPKDLISIIAKDPAKQKEIQEKALRNAEEIAKEKAAAEAAAQKEKEASASKESLAKPAGVTAPAATATPPTTVDPRSASRPAAPQHTSSQGGPPNRHPNARSSYNSQPHYNNYNRNGRNGPHMGPQNQATGNLSQRLRNLEQQKMHQPHVPQHPPMQDMRPPPTGPSNNGDQFGRRISGVPPPYLAPKLNPNSHEFRPNAFAQPFNPAVPSQGSSPRSSVNNVVVEAALPPTPVPGQLIRRKTKAVDVKKCLILSNIASIQPPQGRNYDENGGLKPAFDTTPTWKQLVEETEQADSTMLLTYDQYFAKLPLSSAAVATPNPSSAVPHQIAHQHQLPFHMQHGAQNLAPRQSPHVPPMQMQGSQHAHAPHVPFSAPDDHRMMPSHSAQSFASPRMGQVPMAYPPAMNASGQMAYGQPLMQPYMNPAAPQMGQHRSFSNNPQFMPQQPQYMGGPMMVQPHFMQAPNGMVAGPMYPAAHPQFIPPGGVPPQQMAGSNGYPSPSRPAATMMVHQGSHQGQPPAVYGMSPAMQFQQPAYTPQQPQARIAAQRPQ